MTAQETSPNKGPEKAADNQAVFQRLAAMLQMEDRLRRAERAELPFITVNETRLLVPYRQAALWRADGGRLTPAAVSGLAVLEGNSPYIQWLSRLGTFMNNRGAAAEGAEEGEGRTDGAGAVCFMADDLPPELKEDWAKWLPTHGLFLKLPRWPEGAPHQCGALALFSPRPFTQADLSVLQHLAGAYGQALSLLWARPAPRMRLTRRLKYIIALVALILLLPVRQSVLAPAEVIAARPWPVRAPLEGVVEEILVEPYAEVTEGQPLLRLDTTELQTRLAVAAKSLEIARAELRQARQGALSDREARLRLAYLGGRVEQLEDEKTYAQSLLERAEILSPAGGLALLDAPEQWAGRPVSLGQAIMTVADPLEVRLEIFVPGADFLPQKAGDRLLFFPNTSPTSPHGAVIYQTAFQARESPQAGLAFRLRAEFEPEGPLPRLGVRGRAKLYGPRAPLIYLFLRQPINKLRQWLGL